MRLRWWVLVGVGVAAAAGGGYTGYVYSTRSTLGGVEPSPGAVVTSATPRVAVAVNGDGGVVEVRVQVDGRPVLGATTQRSGRIGIATGRLADGNHRVRLDGHVGGVFGGPVAREWGFTVDTQPPALTVLTPALAGWTRAADISGRSEPGATVALSWAGGSLMTTVPKSGLFQFDPPVEQGTTPFSLTVTDAAGNRTTDRRTLRLDNVAPAITPQTWPTVVNDTDSPLLLAETADANRVRYQARLDGEAFHVQRTPTGVRLEMHGLAQGRHRLTMRAVDAAGNGTEAAADFIVDSTEVLGPNLTLGPGARGRDVISLTRRLRLEGAWRRKRLSREYTPLVTAAVKRYQRTHELVPDGIARPALLKATQGKLVVIKHLFKVFVYRDGKLTAKFPVAIGQPAYPSPTGQYVVVEKIRNPTWIPPNSPWAKGLEPIPPGAGNPLGTRWIGTSAPAVGFHGTPQDWSIGTAASHGCIRMHIPDVEKMFELVDVGMTVVFKV